MGRIIPLSEAQTGEVVLNFCDPNFIHDEDLQPFQAWNYDLTRLLAYTLYAKRVIIPSRYLLRNTPLFQMVSYMPELLQEEIIVPDLRAGASSFEEIEVKRGRCEADIECARFLDRHSSKAEFDSTGQGKAFHSQILEDLEPTGALGRMLGEESFEALASISARFSDTYGRDTFVEIATEVMPELGETWEKWAGVRYYTTPMLFDKTRVRDLPQTAMRLLEETGSVEETFIVDPTLKGIPNPMGRIAETTEVFIPTPTVFLERDLRMLAEAIMLTRQAVPQACGKFSDIVSAVQAREVSETLNDALKSALNKEIILSNISFSLREQILYGAEKAGSNALIGVALGSLGPMAPLAKAGVDVLQVLKEFEEEKARAPFKVSVEYFTAAMKLFLGHEV